MGREGFRDKGCGTVLGGIPQKVMCDVDEQGGWTVPAFEMPVLCAAEAWRSALGGAGPSHRARARLPSSVGQRSSFSNDLCG